MVKTLDAAPSLPDAQRAAVESRAALLKAAGVISLEPFKAKGRQRMAHTSVQRFKPSSKREGLQAQAACTCQLRLIRQCCQGPQQQR